jgi:hypothetical protein
MPRPDPTLATIGGDKCPGVACNAHLAEQQSLARELTTAGVDTIEGLLEK